MKSIIWWIVAIVLGILLLVALLGIGLIGYFWTGRYSNMMGGYGMMGTGYGYMHPFGWAGMLLGWLIPLAVITLLVIGGVVLVININKSRNPTPPATVADRTCLNCGRPAQADWQTCPYCGQKLA